ncbi:phasin family protein [Salinarimonas ramus]|uniref:ENTH domain-containing protein n=1 Tax=Salinarimonas ramus TaxID=690164 RepID=A0A917QAP6_9HYPH|nr:phasin family protein [Salinarimonas ramus]GGK36969.1 hypothetical protein GCM10011322_24970 [Salinarimonas ramus]
MTDETTTRETTRKPARARAGSSPKVREVSPRGGEAKARVPVAPAAETKPAAPKPAAPKPAAPKSAAAAKPAAAGKPAAAKTQKTTALKSAALKAAAAPRPEKAAPEADASPAAPSPAAPAPSPAAPTPAPVAAAAPAPIPAPSLAPRAAEPAPAVKAAPKPAPKAEPEPSLHDEAFSAVGIARLPAADDLVKPYARMMESGTVGARTAYSQVRESNEAMAQACFASAAAASRGMATLNAEMLDLMRANTDLTLSVMRSTLTAGSLSEAVKLQTSGARQAYETTSAHMRAIAEATTKLVGETTQPIADAITKR